MGCICVLTTHMVKFCYLACAAVCAAACAAVLCVAMCLLSETLVYHMARNFHVAKFL